MRAELSCNVQFSLIAKVEYATDMYHVRSIVRLKSYRVQRKKGAKSF
jgi:hypothetical protein